MPSPHKQGLVDANNALTIAILQKLTQVGGGTATPTKSGPLNTILSPFNVAQVLTVIMIGCKNETLAQMIKVLHYDSIAGVAEGSEKIHEQLSQMNNHLFWNAKGNVTLELANGVYPDAKFLINPQFEQVAKKFYKTTIRNMDFLNKAQEAETAINQDVFKATHEKIKELLPKNSLDENTRLVITSALYFKGSWTDKFDKKLSAKVPFTTDTNIKVDLLMMQGLKKCPLSSVSLKTGEMSPSADNDSSATVRILRLDYVGLTQLSMYFLLPPQGRLPDLVKRLDAKMVKDIITTIEAKKMSDTKVRVSIPLFKIEYKNELKDMLQSLGLVDIFGPNADLRGLSGRTSSGSDSKRLYLSKVYHKASIEVNEDGSEASAATAGVIMMRSMLIHDEFTVNRPFMYFIADTSRIFFIGTYNGPTLPNTPKLSVGKREL